MRLIGDDRAVVVTPSRLEIAALELRASEFGPQIGSRKEVAVTTERLVFDAPIVANGAKIQIVSRELIGGANARIDVSGIDGVDAPATPKPKPALGQHTTNVDGANGGDAGSAGQVEILGQSLTGPLVIVARGGQGGDPQPGGNGADGTPGAHGRNPRNQLDGQGSAGGDGGPAGRAGRAGAPGASTAGGTIVIYLANGAEGITTDVSGGLGVPAASNGAAGRPGSKGNGGRRTLCRPRMQPCKV